jgi:hypothetical protein
MRPGWPPKGRPAAKVDQGARRVSLEFACRAGLVVQLPHSHSIADALSSEAPGSAPTMGCGGLGFALATFDPPVSFAPVTFAPVTFEPVTFEPVTFEPVSFETVSLDTPTSSR